MVGSTYKQVTEYVTEHTNITPIVQNEFKVSNQEKCSLVGLHTCGSLSTTCLKLFTEPKNCLKLLVNVGCCYHLIEEEFTVDPIWHDVEYALNRNESYGFPVSKFLRDKHFTLGRDARMCASQSPDKIFNSKDVSFMFLYFVSLMNLKIILIETKNNFILQIVNSTKPLFFRSLLQVYLIQELQYTDIDRCHVGRLANKCLTFNEYLRKAFKRLQLNIEVLSFCTFY